MEKLREAIANYTGEEEEKNPHEVACAPIIERAKFLLKLKSFDSEFEFPTAVSSNPFSGFSSASSNLTLDRYHS